MGASGKRRAPTPRGRGRNQEQSERTREALVAAGRALFAEQGFGATGTEEIVARAGVTRGALYHHYADKTALFREVVEAVERDLCAQLAAEAADLDDPREMLRRCAARFLDLCQEPEVRRIALVDAPSVLGWSAWREIDARYGLGLLRQLMGYAAARGLFEAERVEDLSHLFLGAASEAAMVVANRPDDAATRERMLRSLDWMIERLLAEAPGRAS